MFRHCFNVNPRFTTDIRKPNIFVSKHQKNNKKKPKYKKKINQVQRIPEICSPNSVINSMIFSPTRSISMERDHCIESDDVISDISDDEYDGDNSDTNGGYESDDSSGSLISHHSGNTLTSMDLKYLEFPKCPEDIEIFYGHLPSGK
jgi:hypothetical protein